MGYSLWFEPDEFSIFDRLDRSYNYYIVLIKVKCIASLQNLLDCY